jgi:tetratricopeptide (TPR) repeat protein
MRNRNYHKKTQRTSSLAPFFIAIPCMALVITGIFFALPTRQTDHTPPGGLALASPPSTPRYESLLQTGMRKSSDGKQTEPNRESTHELFRSVRALLENDRPLDAIRMLQDAVEKHPQHAAAAWHELGLIYRHKLNDPALALQALMKSVHHDPENASAVLEIIDIHANRENLNEAIMHIEGLHQKYPNSPNLNQALGDLIANGGDVRGAIPYLENASRHPSTKRFAQSRLAALYRQNNEPEKAIESYRALIEDLSAQTDAGRMNGPQTTVLQRDRMNIELDLAWMLLNLQKYQDASAIAEKLFRIDPTLFGLDSLRRRLSEEGV